MLRLSSLVATALLLAVPAFAEPPKTVATATLSTKSAHELRDLPYVTGGGPSQRLDLYLPASSGKPAPLVVFIHGGGWQAGSKAAAPAKPLVDQGFAVASIEYRFSHDATYPAQIEDCKAAIRWLRAHASEYRLDPERIGAWGASAGGHLVALLGTTGHLRDFDVGENLDQSSRVQCVIDWFGPSDFEHWGDTPVIAPGQNNPVTKLLGGRDLAKARRASPTTFIRNDAAPFLIMHGDRDTVVPLQQSTRLNSLLQQAGVESTLKVIAGNGHGGPGFSSPETISAMGAFLQKHLRSAGAE